MKRHVVVIGDLVEDVTVDLERSHLSPEGMVTHRVVGQETSVGGAALVVRHLVALGCRVTAITDGASANAPWNSCVWYSCNGHVRKTRFYCDGLKFKVNQRCGSPRPSQLSQYLVNWDDVDSIVAWDNGDGFFTDEFALEIVRFASERSMPLYVDCQAAANEPNFKRWAGAHAVFVNEREARTLDANLFDRVHLKLGERGSVIYDVSFKNERPQLDRGIWHDGFKVDVADAVGAGDAYLAAWAAWQHLGSANAWAALSCTKRGPYVPSMEEFERFCASTPRQR